MVDFLTILRIIVRWILVFISLGAFSCIIYCFVGVFAKKTLYKILFTTLVVAFSVGLYVLNHRQPKVIRMKEDTLYIKPMVK